MHAYQEVKKSKFSLETKDPDVLSWFLQVIDQILHSDLT